MEKCVCLELISPETPVLKQAGGCFPSPPKENLWIAGAML